MPTIFVLQNGQLAAMNEAPYVKEADLQTLLAEHPELLAGSGSDDGRRTQLISQEQSVPDSEGGGNVWALDHLFLDSEGLPIFCEVKRSTDTRIRREVVGQMLDYAANATAYWTVERLQLSLEQRCDKAGTTVDEVMTEFLGEERDEDAYWQRVEANLRSGNVRLVFVADKIPVQLRRVIEFLNEQMRQTEVIGVEVRRYTDAQDKVTTIVSQIVGQTAQAQQQKACQPRTAIEPLTWGDYKQRYPAERYELIRALYDRVEAAVKAHPQGQAWEPVLRVGYLTFQRSGGFAVIAIGTEPGGAISFRLKMRRDPAKDAVPNPYPELGTPYWNQKSREWKFVVHNVAEIPDDLSAGVALTAAQQPQSGPMPHT